MAVMRALDRMPLLGACLLLQACSMPIVELRRQDVTTGTPPPVTPVALGQRARAVAVGGNPLKGNLHVHVEPSDAVIGLEGRARCTRPGARPGSWQAASITRPYEPGLHAFVEYELDCPDQAAVADARIELELSEVCVEGECEVLRFDMPAQSGDLTWPPPEAR
jgi:hypothetical protein